MRYAKRVAATLLVLFFRNLLRLCAALGLAPADAYPGRPLVRSSRVAAEGLRPAGSLLGALASPF